MSTSHQLMARTTTSGRPTLVELKSVLADAVTKGVTVRVSGQRHSQPPLVTNDNRGTVPPQPTTYLVDMSCYADLGPESTDLMVLGPGANQVTVNPGTREDDLDAFLTKNNLMLETVTAGGFFSIGGMTAVDVHGGTVECADLRRGSICVHDPGRRRQRNNHRQTIEGWAGPLAPAVCASVAGQPRRRDQDDARRRAPALGKHAPRRDRENPAHNQGGFRYQVQRTVDGTDETCPAGGFFRPTPRKCRPQSNFLLLWWDVVANPNPQIPNPAVKPKSACELSRADEFGAPLIGIIGGKCAEAFIRATTDDRSLVVAVRGPGCDCRRSPR